MGTRDLEVCGEELEIQSGNGGLRWGLKVETRWGLERASPEKNK